MISKCYELVKLCHINRSGPVFVRYNVVCGLSAVPFDNPSTCAVVTFDDASLLKDT